MADSVDYINGLMQSSGAPLKCNWSESKGRVLTVTAPIAANEIMFRGPLLHKVAESLTNPIYIELTRLFHVQDEGTLDYSPMWYWCALNSLPFVLSSHLTPISQDQFKQLNMLYHPEVIAPSPTIRKVVNSISRFFIRPLSEDELLALDVMTIIWTLNCFEHAEDPLTYASFFLPSFMSHSCGPTAMWTTIGDTFTIRAQRPMQIGEELTVSYLSEVFALRPISRRREHLQSTKFFTCDCPRCTAEVDDTRGFPIPVRLGLTKTCCLRFPKFDSCACGCETPIVLTETEIEKIIALEAQLVDIVTELDGSDEEDSVPARPDPRLFPSDETADSLSNLIDKMGLFHWASVRGLYQLAEYYKSIAMYPRAIEMTRKRIEGRRKYIHMGNPKTSSGLAWALEELGDLLLLHVSGSVVAGLSEEARERFCRNWNPRSSEDLETLDSCGALEAYQEAVQILENVFGSEHEHTKTACEKLSGVKRRLERQFS